MSNFSVISGSHQIIESNVLHGRSSDSSTCSTRKNLSNWLSCEAKPKPIASTCYLNGFRFKHDEIEKTLEFIYDWAIHTTSQYVKQYQICQFAYKFVFFHIACHFNTNSINSTTYQMWTNWSIGGQHLQGFIRWYPTSMSHLLHHTAHNG